MLLKLVLTLVLVKLGECSKPDFILSHENGTDYEMVYFKLDKFGTSSIIEFDYRMTHYKVELIKNRHISPIIHHQIDENTTVTQDRKPEDSWYEHISCTFVRYIYIYSKPYATFWHTFCKQSLSWLGIKLPT